MAFPGAGTDPHTLQRAFPFSLISLSFALMNKVAQSYSCC